MELEYLFIYTLVNIFPWVGGGGGRVGGRGRQIFDSPGVGLLTQYFWKCLNTNLPPFSGKNELHYV